ncbi:MAG TPA: DUF2243 domain-containing protein [Mycobacteriales bacterium]|nr:DUF2243 domain-containing protein [Mycobacteriales bacterium]
MPQRSTRTGRRRELGAVLIALGVLGVVDNVVVHWLLGWHRLKDGWEHNTPAEIGLVVLGAVAVVVGRRLRRTATD